METITLSSYEIDFIKDLLLDHMKSKHSDRDTRLLANDTYNHILNQAPEKYYTTSLLTGEVIAIDII